MKNFKKTWISAILVLLLISSALFSSCSAQDSLANEKIGASDRYAETAPSVSLDKEGVGDFPESNKDNTSNGVENEPKIIRTFTVNAETKEYDSTISTLYTLIDSHSGYVSSSKVTGKSYNNYGEKYSRQATFVIRIPADQVDAFVSGLDGSMNVTSSSSSEQDVCNSYYSITARMETLNTERQSLLAMMSSLDNAKDYDFWYTLQKRISEIEQQLAEYQAQIDIYDNKVSYSTVTLSISEVFEYTPTTVEKPSFFERVSKAFSGSWKAFGEFCMDFAIFVVAALPVFLVLAVLGISALLIVKAIIKKKKKQ